MENVSTLAVAARKTNWRWVICSLLFFATTINYLDRQVLSLTWKDFIAPEFHWTDSDYGAITGFFSLFYAVVSLFAGKFIDWMGSRKGYLWAIFVWSLAACLHGACGWATMKIEGLDSVEALAMVESGSALALSIATVSVCFPWMPCIARNRRGWKLSCGNKGDGAIFPRKRQGFRHFDF